MTAVKIIFLRLCKAVGLFRIARYLLRRRLCIIGYHGFELADESKFDPKLFMQASVFESRLSLLYEGRYNVISLQEGLNRLRQHTLPPSSVVLTIDDGFFSVLEKAAPLLTKYRYPSTLYVTTYYSDKGAPVFRLAVRYIFWRTRSSVLHTNQYAWSPHHTIDLQDSTAKNSAMWAIIRFGESECDEPTRQVICKELATTLNVNYDEFVRFRRLTLLNADELATLVNHGIDVQLHTHRHKLPTDNLLRAQEEIYENRRRLSRVLGRQPRHLCYPDGAWDTQHWALLKKNDIESAVTCDPGFNTSRTPLYALRRFLDQNNLCALEFEAEVSGFRELLRLMAAPLTRPRRDRWPREPKRDGTIGRGVPQ